MYTMHLTIRISGINSNIKQEKKIDEAIQAFLVFLKASGRAKSTIACYRNGLSKLLKAIGNISMRQINPYFLEAAVIDICRIDKNSDQAYCAATQNKIKSIYRSFFKWAVESGQVEANPAKGLQLTRNSSRQTLPITPEEIDRLLETIRCTPGKLSVRDTALFAVYAYTGIRRSSALLLNNGDYDSKKSRLTVPYSKNGTTYQVPVVSALKAHIDRHVFQQKNASIHPDFPMFTAKNSGKRLSNRQVNARFSKWRKLSGIRSELTPHSFRSGFADILYQSSKDLLLVSAALGHLDIRVTRSYLQKSAADMEKAVENAFYGNRQG